MNEMETVIFGMISQVGSARSSYLEGLRAARGGDFEEAEAKITRRKRITRKRAPRAP